MSWLTYKFRPVSKMNQLGCYLIAILSSICARTYGLSAINKQGCEVEVTLPWESYTFIPQESSVYINCTAESSQNPGWTIQLPERASIFQFTFMASIRTLNDHGFYQLPEIDLGISMRTIQLLINSTNVTRINGTVVRCDDTGEAASISQTTLIFYEPTPADVYLTDIDIQRANVSWNPLSPPSSLMIEDVSPVYTLTVTSSNTPPQILQLHQPYYVFNAPGGAPPCEVYNFSVTATYVGASYTGASCSVPSPVFSEMLPSLPDISRLESSMEYSLEKDSDKGITLNVFFTAANYCASYPVTNYSLDIQGPATESLVITSGTDSMEIFISAHNLTDNSMYTASIIVISSQGNISTNNKSILYTTDVQRVHARPVGNSILLQCEFITGTDAQGCSVVLVGRKEIDNVTFTMNIIKTNTSTSLTKIERLINSTYLFSCYQSVHGFDIESDGLIGALAVPGELLMNTSLTTTCNIQSTSPPSGTDGAASRLWIIGLVIGIIVFIIIVFLLSCSMICIYKKRSHRTSNFSWRNPLASSSTTQLDGKDGDASSPQTGQPEKQNVSITTPGDGADKSCSHMFTDANCSKLAEEHIYHVLENQKDPLFHKLESPITEQPPLYQEVGQILTSRAGESTTSSAPNEYACIR